jgi:hypothetical protein
LNERLKSVSDYLKKSTLNFLEYATLDLVDPNPVDIMIHLHSNSEFNPDLREYLEKILCKEDTFTVTSLTGTRFYRNTHNTEADLLGEGS